MRRASCDLPIWSREDSIKAERVRHAKAAGTSFNPPVATAVGEKLAATNPATVAAERRARGS